MKQIMIRIIQGVMIVTAGMLFTVFLQASAVLAGPSDFTKPYHGVKTTLGERPLLVLLLGPDDPRMWGEVNVYALKPDGYIGQSSVRVTGSGQLDKDWHLSLKLQETQHFISAPAVMNSPDGNLASVFALGQDGYIYQIIYSRGPNGGWREWQRLPGALRFSSAPAVINSPDGSLAEVFAQAEDGYIYQIIYSRGPNGGWREWQRLPGALRFSSAPAVMNSPNGNLASVFALGQDGYIYQVVYSRGPNGGWREWQGLPAHFDLAQPRR